MTVAAFDDAAWMTKLLGIELVAVTKTRSPEATPVAPEQLTMPVEDAVMFALSVLQTPLTICVMVVPLEPTLTPPVAVVTPVTPSVPPMVALLVTSRAVLAAENVVAPVKVFALVPLWVYPPAVVMLVLMVVAAPTSVAPSATPPTMERAEKATCLRELLRNVMIKIIGNK